MTVPFIMSLGVGVAAVRSGKKSGDDSFGLVALSSIGPILAVLVLGIIYKAQGGEYPVSDIVPPETTQSAFIDYGRGLGEYALDVLFDGRKRGVHARGAGNRQSACRFLERLAAGARGNAFRVFRRLGRTCGVRAQ